MNFVLKPPSLEQMALGKMAVSLWNQNDVRALIQLAKAKCLKHFHPMNKAWKEVEARVLERVAQLSLPKILKENVSGFIQLVGFQILQWIDFHSICDDLPVNLLAELCWTPQGTVDRKRTAEVLVKDESLDIGTRYKLACVYCMEEDIIALWNTLSEDLKQSNWDYYPPIGFWVHTMKERGLGNARTSYQEEFLNCARKGNKVAVEYFLQKLTPLEREVSLVHTAKYVTDADTLCFLLSEMEEEQQMEVFKKKPSRVLQCFLQWPWQSFFMEIANRMWDFLPKEKYEYTLNDIIDKVAGGYKDCNYKKLFGEFWQKSPEALKSLITNDLDKNYLLPSLFDIKDKEIVRLLLQDATHTTREKFIYRHYFFLNVIYHDEWDYLEFIIRECFPSKDLMSKFKEQFGKRENWNWIEDIFVRNKDEWDKLFLSSDDSFREYEKRRADESESSSSKRFRSLE